MASFVFKFAFLFVCVALLQVAAGQNGKLIISTEVHVLIVL